MKLKLYFLALLACSTFFIWSAAFGSAPGVLMVSFLDVGQGDAIFIESPSGRQILIDGGPQNRVLRTLGSVMPLYDRSIDVLIATHPDADHIGGLPEILERFAVGMIVDTGAINETQIFNRYVEKKDAEGALYVRARRGQVFDLGDGAYIRILFPDRELSPDAGNDGSIVLQVVYGESEVLLSGDAGQSVEHLLVAKDGTLLASDILKAGHHGSKTSSASAFVSVVSPSVSIISAECDSRYGHPHQEVMTLLEEISDEVLGTCEEGTITFVSNGVEFVRR